MPKAIIFPIARKDGPRSIAPNKRAVIGHNGGPPVERRSFRIGEFVKLSGVSRSSVYRLIADGKIENSPSRRRSSDPGPCG